MWCVARAARQRQRHSSGSGILRYIIIVLRAAIYITSLSSYFSADHNTSNMREEGRQAQDGRVPPEYGEDDIGHRSLHADGA